MVMRRGPFGEEVILQECQRIAGVQDVLHNDDVPASDVLLQVVGDLHPTGGYGGVLVGTDGDKLHVALQLAGPDQIRHKHEGALQHSQKQRVLALEVLVQAPRPARSIRALDFLLRHQNLQDILFHLTVHGQFSSVSL